VSIETWLLFCATETVLCLTPGPAVLTVVSLALARGARQGVLGAAGVLTANALYFAASATGIAAVLVASWEVFFAIKWLGAAYLVWMGVRMLRARPQPAAATAPRRARRALGTGFLTQGANPKALLFFTALLPQFVDPAAPVAAQVAVLAASSIAIELVVLCGYALLAGRTRRLADSPRFGLALQRGGGALLVGAGAGLAALRRR
jgi:homoserine/homoserine lactone efflux protein